MTRRFANNPQAILNGAIATTPAAGTAESWPVTVQAAVAPGGAWPTLGAGDDMVCLVDAELIRVTAGTTTVGNHNWTVERGYEGTPTAVHANAAPVKLELTADSLAVIEAGYATAGPSDQARASLTTAIAAANGVPTAVAWDTENWDTNGLHDTVTNPSRFTIQHAGRYSVVASMEFAANAAGVRLALIYLNGAQIVGTHTDASSTGVTQLPVLFDGTFAVGDYLELFAYQDSGGALNIDGGGTTWMSVKRLDGVFANANDIARYTTAAGQSIPTNALTIVNFDTSAWDPGGHVTTGAAWKYTATVAGKYRINTCLLFDSAAWGAAGNYCGLQLFKNGALSTWLDRHEVESAHTGYIGPHGTAEIDLAAGDYIDLRVIQTATGGAVALLADPGLNYVEISRFA